MKTDKFTKVTRSTVAGIYIHHRFEHRQLTQKQQQIVIEIEDAQMPTKANATTRSPAKSDGSACGACSTDASEPVRKATTRKRANKVQSA
jgi:hypothetical protein